MLTTEISVFIQPTQSILIIVKIGQDEFECQMVSLSESELVLNCTTYFEKGSNALFHSQFFRGTATVKEIHYLDLTFKYTLFIEQIHFQPGLLINTRL